MSEAYALIVVTCGLLGLVMGFVLHRSDFCVTGMFRDFFLFRDTTLLRSLVLLVATSMLLFELGRLSGLIKIYPFPLLGLPSGATLMGASSAGSRPDPALDHSVGAASVFGPDGSCGAGRPAVCSGGGFRPPNGVLAQSCQRRASSL